MSITDKHMVFSGECTRGRTVTVELPDDGELHPFHALAVRQGKKAGQRLAIVVIQIGDQEEPVVQEHKLSQQAAILCRDPGFRSFIQDRSISLLETEEDVRQWMYHGAGITSRKAFDNDTRAANWFNTQCKMPYEAHRRMIDSNIL
jgi:hypothetical protein